MKALIFTALLLAASQANAVQKCVIDGKTLYKSGPCTQGITKPISAGSVSYLSLTFANGASSLPAVRR
jgi:hypothetical protein